MIRAGTALRLLRKSSAAGRKPFATPTRSAKNAGHGLLVR